MSVKLEKLIISNFKSIGNTPISIELDDIVVLVGGNNYGKSTILKAYQAAVNNEKITKDDFHNKIINDPNSRPTIELYIICDGDDRPSANFQETLQDGSCRVKEKYVWDEPNSSPSRVGFRVDLGRYPNIDTDATPHRPWASDNASRKKRPKAHLIGTFDNPDQQSDSIKTILVEALLEEKIRNYAPSENVSNFGTLHEQFNELKKEFVLSTKEEIHGIAKEISDYASKIVPGYKFDISISDSDLEEKSFKLFDSKEINISFGKNDYMFPVSNHGSGARRTLLWSVLKKIADLGFEACEKGKFKKLGDIKSHLLLLDEPELSLHPSACRQTRDMLYDIAEKNQNWQVMITTHSPCFIDLTRDHTKIIRVENQDDKIIATTIFKPDMVNFSEDDIETLKLLNMLNPDSMEFFFGGRVLLVEGDTEHTAFGKIIRDIKSRGDTSLDDVLIVRCGGKVQVSMFMKILNHFKKKYFVLHDIDSKEILKNRQIKNAEGVKEKQIRVERNPAWTNNSKIFEQFSEYSTTYGSVINFETAYFDLGINSGKPENAINMLKEPDIYTKIKNLLLAIVNETPELLPDNAIRWNNLEELEERFEAYAKENPEIIPTVPLKN
ncbi:ATP-dependent nuclease [Aeromonas veronii]|uniref:ATP-dependent nuclease n=1 Tax=Aeromonas veronii TaxID=654 RepID=UPI00111692AD|nr:AAA family ATPase [Aeromonas veronii]MBL0638958.1 AAA family ATPase [Aeromonas veronii]TNI25749.1 ATP-dependent endonuclease [Aeromonas veronii]